jgi:hypothetical protein
VAARETLERRWGALVGAPREERPRLFRETRDRSVTKRYAPLVGQGARLPALSELDADAPAPAAARYAYRSLDRQCCLLDSRLADFPRPVLWPVSSARQLYMTSL